MHRAINAFAMKNSVIKRTHHKIPTANPLSAALNYINWAICNWDAFRSTLMMDFAARSNSSAVSLVLNWFQCVFQLFNVFIQFSVVVVWFEQHVTAKRLLPATVRNPSTPANMARWPWILVTKLKQMTHVSNASATHRRWPDAYVPSQRSSAIKILRSPIK